MVEPRLPQPTVNFVDEYCEAYKHLFPEVRSFEAFKHLHMGMISDIKRKSLPAIAKVVGIGSEQSLHHFLPLFCHSPNSRNNKSGGLTRRIKWLVLID
jgi:SRSO17 transposase